VEQIEAGGAFAIEGGTAGAGCVRGAGRLGPAPGPEGGAKFSAGPVAGTSGTAAGGTGGGRSENIWADTTPGPSASSTAAKASARRAPWARPMPATPLPLQIMAMLFTENAANSSLREPAGAGFVEPRECPNLNADVVFQSYFPP